MLFDFDEKNNSTIESFTENALNSMQNSAGAPVKFETIIGEKSKLTGNIEGAAPICINGTLVGNIDSTGYVYISKTGHVQGDVKANHLTLIGSINGKAVEAGKLDITSTGAINADIKAERLTVEEGGILNGKITISGAKKAAAPAAPVAPAAPAEPANTKK